MASTIGGGRRRTLAPRHNAIRSEAGKPHRVAKALASGAQPRLESRPKAALRGRLPRAAGNRARPLVGKAQHNRPRPVGRHHVEGGYSSEEACRGGCASVGWHAASSISFVLGCEVILNITASDEREPKAEPVRAGSNVDLDGHRWQGIGWRALRAWAQAACCQHTRWCHRGQWPVGQQLLHERGAACADSAVLPDVTPA